jgi:hypothetical protein
VMFRGYGSASQPIVATRLWPPGTAPLNKALRSLIVGAEAGRRRRGGRDCRSHSHRTGP